MSKRKYITTNHFQYLIALLESPDAPPLLPPTKPSNEPVVKENLQGRQPKNTRVSE